MKVPDNRAVAEVLREIGVLLDLTGENPFKVRAFDAAARTVETLDASVAKLVEDGALGEQKGIGKTIKHHVTVLVKTGALPYLDELRAKVPAGLVDMLRVPSLGPKKARYLREQLGISSIAELEYACHENRLVALKGFGEKTQNKILEGIRFIRLHEGRFLLSDALQSAEEILEYLKKSKDVRRIEIAGSLRRRRETVKDVDVVASSKNPAAVMEHFTKFGGAAEITAKGETKSSIRLSNGIACDLRIVSDREFPFALHHLTGSKEHNVAIRSRAAGMGLKVNEYGIFKGAKSLPAEDEKELYGLLGLDFIPPELREDAGEIAAAAERKLPVLLEQTDLKGLLHVHTTASDGTGTLEEMAEAAVALGLKYIGIADHSKTASYAGGMDEKRLLAQVEEIGKLNKNLAPFRLLAGSEVDILKNGSLDFSDEILKKLDFVIASVHTSFTLPKDEMMRRIIRAMENPHVDVIGHPTGRLLLGRDAYAFDEEEFLKAAARTNTAVELNAHPSRLDISGASCRRAKQLGVKIVINPDAHKPEGLSDVQYGLWTARRGWLEKDDVLNSLDATALLKALKNAKTK
jgi:DNA polymerase (family 10)